jgi:hypothetical protein
VSELRIETMYLPAAEVGPENPLPALANPGDVHASKPEGTGIPDQMLENMAYARIPNILPYTIQDGYHRRRQPRGLPVAVLENETLRATFALELGGRLWSLVHKPSGRELFCRNPVFQPANLALRNAWFSGGVEWNIGMIGHCPFTCSPLFAARARTTDGTPVLRLYEWERIRQTPFQIDAYLPDGSSVLFVRIRILNPHDRVMPTYWWSNMAAPESPDTRVLVPADQAYGYGYGAKGLTLIPIPRVDGIDASYTVNTKHSGDFFFHIPDGERPFICALDGQGRGVVQTSTALLKGRKLFFWGTGPGGNRWQQFLSEPGHPYLEIQSGLARTQMEHLPMPARTEWAWLEAYGLLEADPGQVHDPDWRAARQAAADRLEALIPRAAVEAEFARGAAWVDRAPEELIQRGSGWGALELRRRAAAGEPPFCSDAMVFDAPSLGPEQEPWLELLAGGTFGAAATRGAPRGYMVQQEWRDALEKAAAAGDDWLAWVHLGVMRYYAGDRDGARAAWQRSLAGKDTPWARRNLAVLAWEDKDHAQAARLYRLACRLEPDLLPLAVEAGERLLEAGLASDWLELVGGLSPQVQSAGRVRLLAARGALAVKDFAKVQALFDQGIVVDDLREGEQALSHLWFEYHEQRLSALEGVEIDAALKERVRREHPVPAELDFRMS